MHPLTSTRRIAIAAILAVALGAGGIASVGTAAAGEPAFSLPPRHAGDRVEYTWTGAHGDGTSTLEQLPLFAWKDAAGTYHLADGILEQLSVGSMNGRPTVVPIHSYLDGYEPLAATQGGGYSGGYSQGLLGDTETTSFYTSSLVMDTSRHPCGFVNSLQGAQGDRMQAVCPGGPDIFQLDGHAPWQDATAAVYASGDTRLWFLPDVPYPVRVESQNETLEMTGFSRGQEALVPVPLPADTPLPAVRTVPRPALGVDMAGVELPYPLEQAVEEAKEDLFFSDLRDYLSAHPDAQLVRAEHEGDAERQDWWLEWADDASRLVVLVTRERPVAERMVADHLEPRTWQVHHSSFERARGHDRPLPASAPAMADVVAAWQTYVETDELPRVVGFSWPDCDCPVDVYAGSVGAGSTDNRPTDVLEPPSSSRHTGHTLHYDGSGSLVAIDIVERVETRSGPLAAPPESTVQAGPEATSGWAPPSAGTATGIGLGAVVVALLYWAWPALKAVPVFGLRWRRRPELLDHPARRQIHDLVARQPGIHYQAVVKHTGLGKGASEHHLRRLVSAGLLTKTAGDGYTCYFPKGTDRRAASAAAVLKSEGAQRVLAAIQERPGAAVTEVASATGLSPGTVTHHLRRLRQRGLVESWRDGRTVRLRAGAVTSLLA